MMKVEMKAVRDIMHENGTKIDVIKDTKKKFDAELDTIKKEFVKIKDDIVTLSPVSSPCCEFRCCSGTYSPARGYPGPGHPRFPICCNHNTKI